LGGKNQGYKRVRGATEGTCSGNEGKKGEKVLHSTIIGGKKSFWTIRKCKTWKKTSGFFSGKKRKKRRKGGGEAFVVGGE